MLFKGANDENPPHRIILTNIELVLKIFLDSYPPLEKRKIVLRQDSKLSWWMPEAGSQGWVGSPPVSVYAAQR